jgi:hypothetical protein
VIDKNHQSWIERPWYAARKHIASTIMSEFRSDTVHVFIVKWAWLFPMDITGLGLPATWARVGWPVVF